MLIVLRAAWSHPTRLARTLRVTITLTGIWLIVGSLNCIGQQSEHFDISEANTLSWPKDAAEIGHANNIDKKKVEQFVDLFQEKSLGPKLKVGEFRFVTLQENKICLIATTDASGRDLFYTIMIVLPERNGYRRFVLGSDPPHFLPSEIPDLDGDGLHEIVTREMVAGYQGSRSIPVFWYSVYKLRDGELREVSADYDRFYQAEVMAPLSFLNNVLASSGRNKQADIIRVRIEYVQLKYLRIILGEKTAGLKEAVFWSKTNEPEIQKTAIKALSEISDPVADETLRELTRSENSSVSQLAERALEQKLKEHK
jgi:hypothetical protein